MKKYIYFLICSALISSSLWGAADSFFKEREGATSEEVTFIRLLPNLSDDWDEIGTSAEQIVRAIRTVEEVFNSRIFFEEMEKIGSKAFPGSGVSVPKARNGDATLVTHFDYNTTTTGSSVYKKIHKGTLPDPLRIKGEKTVWTFGIEPYRTKWRWSKATGYTETEDNVININLRRFRHKEMLADKDIFIEFCNTLAHELMHCLDYYHTGGTSPEPNSVPYLVGDLVEELLRRGLAAGWVLP